MLIRNPLRLLKWENPNPKKTSCLRAFVAITF